MDPRGIAPPQGSPAPPMAAADRLSDLPDDLLRRILSFAPAREGASTAVLSRRWRCLWRTSGAVNLDTRSYDREHGGEFSFEKRDSFLAGAAAALAAADEHGPVRRLTVDVVTQSPNEIYVFLHCHEHSADEYNMIADVLSLPAAELVEELRVGAAGTRCPVAMDHSNFYKLSFFALPSMALRVLHITNCTELLSAPSGRVFPVLAELKLLGCTMSVGDLKDVINAAPWLTALHLEHTRLTGAVQYSEAIEFGTYKMIERYWLGSSTVTSLVLAKCDWPQSLEGSVELDMPMLRWFRYDGIVHRFSLRSKAPNMTRADLRFTDDGYHELEHPMDELCIAFWQFVKNFDNTKFLKLELECPIESIAIVEKKRQQELLTGTLFSNLERLDLEGRYKPENKNIAVAIANLLHCCPVVHDLRIKLRKKSGLGIDRSSSYIQSSIERKNRLGFNKSVDHFRRRLRPSMILLQGDNDDNCEVSEIPSLSAQSFDCLQTCVRRVSLQFPLEGRNCFGVQLTKFFMENALVLEEMYIGDGNHKMCEHTNHRVKTWIANASKQRGSATTGGFAVLPLET